MSAFPKWVGADNNPHQYYMSTEPETVFPADSQMGRGCVAVKKELKFNGFAASTGFNTTNPLLGDAADKTIKQFQAAKGLVADGQAGPKTCKFLFTKRIRDAQDFYHIPDDLLFKLVLLESVCDPAAIGYVDPRDRGLMQINAGAHPEVSDDDAFDPAFAVEWGAKYLRNNYNTLLDWDAALAAHNIGTFYAKKWLAAGKPATGVLTTGGKDIAVVATNYVEVVRKQVV